MIDIIGHETFFWQDLIIRDGIPTYTGLYAIESIGILFQNQTIFRMFQELLFQSSYLEHWRHGHRFSIGISIQSCHQINDLDGTLIEINGIKRCHCRISYLWHDCHWFVTTSLPLLASLFQRPTWQGITTSTNKFLRSESINRQNLGVQIIYLCQFTCTGLILFS